MGAELSAWLLKPDVQKALKEMTRDAVREELSTFRTDVLSALPNMDELVDAKEAARILSMKEGAIRKATSRGQIKCVRLGRRVRYRRKDLVDLLLREQPLNVL